MLVNTIQSKFSSFATYAIYFLFKQQITYIYISYTILFMKDETLLIIKGYIIDKTSV